jgi:xanthine/uracil permease
MPTFDTVMILTMSLVMIVVMIESTGMYLALSDITDKESASPSWPRACAPTAWVR